MDLTKINVLSVNATIIIGLIILFTFQSISSSFIEQESSDFILKWYAAQNELNAIDFFLGGDCKMLSDDRANYEKFFVEQHVFVDVDGSEFVLFDHLSEEMEKDLKKHCNKLVIEGLEKSLQLAALDEMGYNLNYLQQIDKFGNIRTSLQNHTFDPLIIPVESDYFRDIATGPFWVNVTNMIMIFPFTVSAIIASINLVLHKESKKVSTASIIAMAAGFVIMILGLTNIVYGILRIYEPWILF